MEVSFIISADELFTLMSTVQGWTEAGRQFNAEVLGDAVICDLSELPDKKMARFIDGELELAPVIRMIADAVTRADNITRRGDIWEVASPWVTPKCERYPYREGHWRITPEEETVTP